MNESALRFRPYSSRVSLGLLFGGLILALFIGMIMASWLLSATYSEMIDLAWLLSSTAFISLGVGFVIYYFFARVSPSLLLTLALAYLWTALLMILNVWNGARLMFFNGEHDLPLAVVLLIFASVIATTFGLAVSVRVVGDLRELSRSAEQIAHGNLQTRAEVNGRDEVSQVASSFNDMADKLQEAERVRQEVEQLRRDLVSWTSHDLRTPLTSVRAMIEALRDGMVTDEATIQRYYKNILNDIGSLNSLMNDLFELAQLESGGMEIVREPQTMSDLISDTVEQFHAMAAQNNIRIHGRAAEGLDPVTMDGPLIGRVLSNLISNALRYTPAGGEIAIEAQLINDGQAVQCVVWDSGPGFQPQDLGRVFEQFYRGEQSRSRATGGGGLGLAIARAIIEGHQGSITAANRPEGGALISFVIPRE
ncbi:MAG: ATP-binding protein [Ardenticatenaceae bacterium]|nr:ATP-binding protein [Ardenticatenaceae bacterium]